jgi:hypothetical protein
MVNCTTCRRGLVFTALTLLTIGVSTALFISVVYYFVSLKVQDANKSIFAVLVVAMVVSFLLLVFGFWSSFRGPPCSKAVLAVIYAIYAVALLGIGVCLLAMKGQITDAVQEYFDDNPGELRDAFQEGLNCSWNDTNAASCLDKFKEIYDTFGIGIGVGLIVLAVVLLIGDGFAWKWFCETWRNREVLSNQTNLTEPLTYSW